MHRKKQKTKRHRKQILLGGIFGGFLAISLSVFLFRNRILFYLFHAAGSYLYPETHVAFERVEWEGRTLVFTNVSVEGEGWAFEADRFTVELAFDFKNRIFKPKIALGVARMTLPARGKVGAMGSFPLSSHPSFRPEISVEKGELVRGASETYFVTAWTDGVGAGRLKLFRSREEEQAVLEGEWRPQGLGLDFDVAAKGGALVEAAPFLPFPEGWTPLKGELDLTMSGTLSPAGKLERVVAEGTVRDVYLKLEGHNVALSIKGGKAACSFEGEVLQQGHLSFEGGGVQFPTQSTLAGLRGDLDLKKGSYTGILEGVIARTSHYQPFHLEIKGEGEGKTTGGIAFEDAAAPLLLFSIEKKERGCDVVTSFENIGPDVIDLVQEVVAIRYPDIAGWEISEAGFTGRVTLNILDNGGWQLEVGELVGAGLKLQNLGKGCFVLVESSFLKGLIQYRGQKAEIEALELLLENGELDLVRQRGEIWNFSHLIGRFCVEEKQWKPSFLQGSFLGLEGEINFNGPAWFDNGEFEMKCSVDQLFAFLSQDLADVYHARADIPARISGSFSQEMVRAKCLFGEQDEGSVDFHLPLNSLLHGEDMQIEIAGTHIHSSLYFPFLHEGELEKEGVVSFSGVCNKNALILDGELISTGMPMRKEPIHIEYPFHVNK